MKMAARVRPTLMVTMINQMIHLIFGLARRRRVMAKAVLLQAAAQMDQKPVIFIMKRVVDQLGASMSMSQLCLPKPIVVEMLPKMHEATTVSWSQR